MNYTVLIVEDEENQRRALVDRVQWEKAGFSVIGEAENGAEALDKVETLEPDLIFTDIRMPMISGIELAARVREMRPATQIVILSGYDSFEYAQAAIQYNIVHYLLKPVSANELSEKLFEIHDRMDERLRGVLQTQKEDPARTVHDLKVTEFLLPLLLGGAEKREDEGVLREKAVGLSLLEADKRYRFCVLVTKFKDENGENITDAEHAALIHNILRRNMRCETLIAYGRAITFVAVSEEENALSDVLELPLRELVQTARRMMDCSCTVGVSREFSDLSELSSAYFQAVTARRYTSDGAGEVRFISDRERDSGFGFDRVEKTVLRLEQLLKVGTNEELQTFLDELYEKNTPENANLLVVQIIANVCRVVSNTSDSEELARLIAANPILARITSYNSEAGMRNELGDFCRNAKSIIARYQRRDTEILCDKVVRIIDSRYGDETLSLTGVSRELAVSPNYLSALIKKEKKKNFITLLTERRMKAAYDMLLCSGMKILEISEKCGYSDQHYFSYCFKKFYGESPNRVRGAKGESQG